MRGFQIILLCLLALFATYIFRLRSASSDRVLYLALAAIGVGLNLDPDFTTRLANRVGIGRGVDLMFYFFIIFVLFHFATTGATIRRLQRDVTQLTQALALANARTSEPRESP